MSEVKVRNRMSAVAFLKSIGANAIKVVRNPKNDKLFYDANGVRGYISKSGLQCSSIDDLAYAEFYNEQKQVWVPTLFAKGNSDANVVKTFSL